jgi:hypothetical protein
MLGLTRVGVTKNRPETRWLRLRYSGTFFLSVGGIEIQKARFRWNLEETDQGGGCVFGRNYYDRISE